MTPEQKQQIKEEIVGFYGEVFPGYPDNPAVQQNPGMLIEVLPRVYDRLVSKDLIKKQQIPYKYLEAIAVDKFREASLNDMLHSFF